jgi:hypothetical protein
MVFKRLRQSLSRRRKAKEEKAAEGAVSKDPSVSKELEEKAPVSVDFRCQEHVL